MMLLLFVPPDRFGRKRALMMSLTLHVGCGVATAFSPTYPVFATLRFFMGLSNLGAFLTAYTLGEMTFFTSGFPGLSLTPPPPSPPPFFYCFLVMSTFSQCNGSLQLGRLPDSLHPEWDDVLYFGYPLFVNPPSQNLCRDKNDNCL